MANIQKIIIALIIYIYLKNIKKLKFLNKILRINTIILKVVQEL